ncbi:hypothetical protein D3C80_1210750 [compost metagenome]
MRAVLQQVVHPRFDLGVQLTGRVHLGQQAQLAGPYAAETLGGKGIAACGALADGLDHERADHRRGQADAHFRQAEQRVGRADGHVAAGDQAQRAAEGRALDHGQGRLRQVVETVHQLAQFVSVIEVGGVVELGRLLHPGQVGAGAEVLAAPAQDQQADRRVGLHRGQRGVQLADHLGVEGVVLVGTVQPQGGDAVRIAFELYGGEVGHVGSRASVGAPSPRGERVGERGGGAGCPHPRPLSRWRERGAGFTCGTRRSWSARWAR